MRRSLRFVRPSRTLAGLVATFVVVGLAGVTAVNVAPAASADTTVTVVAGTGVAGYSGDGGLATAATFSGLSAAVVSLSGDVTVLDSSNYALRRFAVGGNVATVAGGTRDCTVIDPAIALGGFCNPAGSLALDPSGNVYVAETSSIRKVDTTGGIYHYAGHYYGTGSYDDGPKFTTRIYPDVLRYNTLAGELDFSEGTAIRKVTAVGTVVTFIGAHNNGNVICTQHG